MVACMRAYVYGCVWTGEWVSMYAMHAHVPNERAWHHDTATLLANQNGKTAARPQALTSQPCALSGLPGVSVCSRFFMTLLSPVPPLPLSASSLPFLTWLNWHRLAPSVLRSYPYFDFRTHTVAWSRGAGVQVNDLAAHHPHGTLFESYPGDERYSRENERERMRERGIQKRMREREL